MQNDDITHRLRDYYAQQEKLADASDWPATKHYLRLQRKKARGPLIAMYFLFLLNGLFLFFGRVSSNHAIALSNPRTSEALHAEHATKRPLVTHPPLANAQKQTSAKQTVLPTKYSPAPQHAKPLAPTLVGKKNNRPSIASEAASVSAPNSSAMTSAMKVTQPTGYEAPPANDVNPIEPSDQPIAPYSSMLQEYLVLQNITAPRLPSSQEKEIQVVLPQLQSHTYAPLVAMENTSELASIDSNLMQQAKHLSALEGWLIQGSALYTLGWKYGNEKEGNGWMPALGLHYQQSFAKHLNIEAGLAYHQLRHLALSSKTSKQSTYGLGEKSIYTSITPQTLHYFSIPLRIGYQFNATSLLGIGYRLSYLMNVNAEVITREVEFGTNRLTTHQNKMGYTEGFSNLDSQVFLFYRKLVSKHFGIGAQAYFGLNDLKNNSFFNRPYTERNCGLYLSVSYHFANTLL